MRLVLLLTLCGTAASAAEHPSAAYLRAARNLFQHLEYEGALEQLALAKEIAPAGNVKRQAEVHLWRGIVLLHLGRDDDARTALVTALSLLPSLELPAEAPPRLVELSLSVKAA